jgi:CxxC motif-containing protein
MKELICIVCPNGCRLHIEPREHTASSFSITGNLCKRGEAFAINEMTNPRRSVTTTVRTVFAEVPVLPVRTAQDIPKEKIDSLMHLLAGITIQKKLGIGDAVVKSALGLGIDVIASSNALFELQTSARK